MRTNEKNAPRRIRRRALDPFRRAVARGLAILLPPLLTIVIFFWVGNTVNKYMLEPFKSSVRWVFVEKLSDIRGDDVPASEVVDGVTELDGTQYHQTADDKKFVPTAVYDAVKNGLGNDPMPREAKGVYERYVDQTWLRPEYVIPIFWCLFVLLLYLLGKFLAAGIGRFFWTQMERVIHRVPLVRNVYGSVKQVTDFLITDPDIQYTRVVAIEWPRRGLWMMCFVTGEGLPDVRRHLNEPVLSLLVPTSPMPFTGFTLTVKKSETLDLNLTLEQAFQFVISCGVVVPPDLLADALAKKGGAAERPVALSAPVGDDE